MAAPKNAKDTTTKTTKSAAKSATKSTAKAPKKEKKEKQDFDKEYIFNLIMPSDPEPDAEDADNDSDALLPEPEPAQSQVRDSLSVLRERINQPAPSHSAVPFRPANDLVLVNLMEQIVMERLDEAFEKFNCCRCDKCRRDVAAITLNLLPPQYVVAEPESLPVLMATCSTREVSVALVKAILQVKNNPKH